MVNKSLYVRITKFYRKPENRSLNVFLKVVVAPTVLHYDSFTVNYKIVDDVLSLQVSAWDEHCEVCSG